MSAYLLLRFVKFVGVALLFHGVVGTFSASTAEDRARKAMFHAAPGFILTWLTGLALVTTTGVPLLSTWIIGAVALSLASLWATLYQGVVATTQIRPLGIVASGGFIGALALMVWKP